MRRRILELLAGGEMSAGAIGATIQGEFAITQPAVSQHLKVLQEAGLVRVRSEGTRRLYSVEPRGLAAVRDWLAGFWDEALSAFKAAAEREAARERKQ